MVELLLAHVPPLVGDKVVVPPTQMEDTGKVTEGPEVIVRDVVVALQPVAVRVKVKVALPAPTPVTTPVLVTVATSVSLLTQVPPVFGVRLAVSPTQMEVWSIVTVGGAFTVNGVEVVVALQPVA